MHQSWMRMILLTRAAVGIFLLTAIALVLAPQTADMLVGIFDNFSSEGIWTGIAFHLSLFVLCFNLWHWSRAVLSAWFDTSRESRNGKPDARGDSVNASALKLVPRFLFLGGAWVGIVAAARSEQWTQAIVIAVWSTAFYGFLARRAVLQPLLFGTRSLPKGGQSEPPSRLPTFLRSLWLTGSSLLSNAPFGRSLAAVTLLVALVLMFAGTLGTFFPFAWWAALPTLIGTYFPGPSAALLFLGLTIGPLTVVTFLFDCSDRVWTIGALSIPVRRIPILVVLASIITLTPVWLNLHAVRIADEPSRAPEARASLAGYFDDWVRRCGPKEGPVRPIIVAVSGGASRAGLWAARVLVSVDAIAQHNQDSIFAISSVSGGSLGAAAYTSFRSGYANDQNDRACSMPQTTADAAHARDTAMVEAMRADALGPTLGGALFGDTPRALLGAPATAIRHIYEAVTGTAAPMRGGDRAEALERAFEHNWDRALSQLPSGHGRPIPFYAAYLSLSYKSHGLRGDVPIWIANGTDAQNGDRVLTVPFKSFDDEPAPLGKKWKKDWRPTNGWIGREWPFLAALDALALVGHDIPISTAISNTARFPFLSPAGELSPVRIDPARDSTQIIDGGYFENEGMTTALELAHWLKRYGSRRIGRPVWPIIVQATADADQKVDPRSIVQCGDSFLEDPTVSHGRERPLQLLAPIEGVFSVRAGHSSVALREARTQFCNTRGGQSFFHFYLFPPKSEDVPLNWVLSRHIAYDVWDYALKNPFNKVQIDKLSEVLEQQNSAPAHQPRAD